MILPPSFRPERSARIAAATLSLLIVLALLIAPSASLPAQQVEEAGYERTGMRIDREEREYFGLFPRIADFESGAIAEQSDGSLRITISRTSAGDTTLLLDQATALQLRRYLYGIESVFTGDLTVDWVLLEKVVRPSAPFESHRPVTVTGTDGAIYFGQILSAGDSVLLLWPVDRPYSWRQLDTLSFAIPASRIRRIVRDQEFYYGIGAGVIVGSFASYVIQANSETAQPALTGLALILPAAVGGYLGSSLGIDIDIDGNRERYLAEHDRLRSRAMFFASVPPEVRALLERTTVTTYDAAPRPPIAIRPDGPAPAPTRFHFGAGIGTSKTSTVAPYLLFTSGRSEALEPILPEKLVHFEAAYSLFERLELGLAYETLNGSDPAADTDDREYIDLTFIELFTDFLLLVPSARALPNVEAAVGVVAVRSESNVRGHLTSPFINSTRDTSYAISGEGFGLGTRLRVAYHPIRYLSIDLALEQMQYTSADVPQSQVTSSIGPVRRLKEHRSDISALNVRGGIRLHF